MLSLWNDYNRIGMPNLPGWDLTRVLDDFSSFSLTAPVEIKHDEDHVVIMADMPGVDPENLDVTFEAGTLSVQGQRGDRSYRFSVYLGNEYDADKIQAELDKGVLTIQAEQKPEAKPRRISLKGAEAKRLQSGDPQ
jgi:HSP20 family protein